MTENFATWTGEPPEATVPEAPEAPLNLSWLPPSVARRQALDEAQHAAQLRAEERQARKDREARAEQAHDDAVGAYVAGAISRGEHVGALDVMAGNLGRTVDEVLAGSRDLADRIPKEHREPVNYIGDAGPAQRSERRGDGWPESSYELDRQLRQADDLHRDRIAYEAQLASRQGRAAEHLEAHRTAANLARGQDSGPGTEITRFVPTPPCSGCGYITCECR